MTLSPGPLRASVWFGIATFGWVAFTACGSEDDSLFGTNRDPNANDAGSGGDAEPSTGGTAAKGGSTATGGATPKGGSPGTGGSATSGGDSGDGGDVANGGVVSGSGGMIGPGKGGSAGSGGKGGCSYAGKSYPVGASFPSEDGCNTCGCSAAGVACTERACAGGGAPGTSCEDQLAKELDAVQACKTHEDCGVPIQGSSCGCTRNLVANKTADLSHVEDLLKTCGLSSTCDCPAADGFVCNNGRCGWNYAGSNACADTKVGSICIRGIPINAGDQLEPGMKLRLHAAPSGCFSSSCTEADVAVCQVAADGADFTASAEFCLRSTAAQGQGCTDDCGGGGSADCESETELSEGTYTLKFGDKTLEFEVPGVIAPGAGCIHLDD